MVHPASNANSVNLGTTETLLHLPHFGSRHGAHVVLVRYGVNVDFGSQMTMQPKN